MFMSNKQGKSKPKYGLFSCVGYSMRLMWNTSRSMAFSAVARIPVSLVLNAIAIYLPTIVISMLEARVEFSRVPMIIVAIIAVQMLLSVLEHYINTKRFDAEHFIVLKMIHERSIRERDMDYYHKLDESNHAIIERSGQAVRNNHTAGVNFIDSFTGIVADILNFALFASIVSLVDPWILLLLIAGCVTNYYMAKWQKKRNWSRRDGRNAINKKLNYLAWTLSGDLSYGKDIRLYNFADLVDKLITRLCGEWYKEQDISERYSFITALVNMAVVLIRDGVAYYVLISQIVAGNISAAEFVLYFSAITKMSTFISNILNTWGKVYNGSLEVSDYREFFDIKDNLNRGPGVKPDRQAPASIEFKNVSFSYPNSEKKILDNVSFRIDRGEKIALVGVNGAGKTTLTMLMCGLLLPDEGEILINGYSVLEYNRDELYSLFSLVPQDYALLPISIAENIAVASLEAGDGIDMERVNSCIDKVGLRKKINDLSGGVLTLLNRQINTDATDLSGGETQKLLLARAIYRNAPILVLDEPTAALDPIAESEMYTKYNELTNNVTSIFISHRLASTRFCDRIILLSGATVAEEGTHTELLKNNGIYAEMFDAQAQYYKEVPIK